MTEFPLTPQIAAAAAVMDEIDKCRNPVPCDLCRQRMQSILDLGAAAERERIRELALAVAGRRRGGNFGPRTADVRALFDFADLLGEEPHRG